ncbi:MAG: hypothetical protein GKS01_17895 [Alphaproteobacteria bacterium]|nr:hypothetical protein [Alphaproteobacteria bacterium]
MMKQVAIKPEKQTMSKHLFVIPILSAAALLLALPATSSADDARQFRGDQLAQADKATKSTKGKKAKKTRISRRTQRFMRLYDLNGDGKVTPEEIAIDQSRILGAMDIDNNKGLSVDEMRRRGRSLQIWQSVTLFDLLDTNGDQKVSAEELSAPMKRWFKRYDENKDGVMEASEVPTNHWRRRGGRRGHGRR